MLNSTDYENILNFSYNLGRSYSNFYFESLNLIAEHFNYTYLAFIPENLNTTSNDSLNKGYYTNFYSINLDNTFLNELKKYYYKVSIFQPGNLPKELLNKTILSIDDVMPYHKFTQTEYCQFLNKYNLYYPLNINLFSDNTKLGVLCIGKTKEHGNFTEKELKICEIFGKVLSINYKNFLTLSNTIVKKNIFKKCYNSYMDGIIIWNNNHSILEINSKAEEFSYEIAEHINIPNNFSYSDVIEPTETVAALSKLLTYLSLNVTHNLNNQTITIKSYNHLYKINTLFITTLGFSGSPETVYCTRITRSPYNEVTSLHKAKTFYNLTDREWEIITLLKKGYSNNEISSELYLSPNTVKTHMSHIFKKLDVNNRALLINKLTFMK